MNGLITGGSKCYICGAIMEDIGPSQTPPFTGRTVRCPNLEDGYHYIKVELKKRNQNFMTFQQFDKYQEELLAQVKHMKDTKGKEYANSEDRFANFNRLAPRLGISNLAVCLVYLTKHMDAIESYCKTERTYSTESIQGRIVDAITYLTLLGGMIKQRDIEQSTDKPDPRIKPFNGID